MNASACTDYKPKAPPRDPPCLCPGDFAALLGTDAESLVRHCGDEISRMDFRYHPVGDEAGDQILLDVLRTLIADALPVSGPQRKSDWEAGWADNLQRFTRSGGDLSQLVPRYVRPGAVKRLNRRYIRPVCPNFELNFYTVYRHYLFGTYLSDVDAVYEFGCGTGYNLIILNRLFPQMHLCGLDWSESSRNLANRIGRTLQADISGRLFDMFHPDEALPVKENCAFLTLNSMEQLGENHEAFIRFMLDKRPRRCIHAEPIAELYDPECLMDYLALTYHRKRGYLSGFLTGLRRFESEGRLKILTARRVPFGSLFHEGYSLVVWEPA